MDFDGPVIHGLEHQARALTSVKGDTDASRFLVGTLTLRSKNKIHLIDFDDDNNCISSCSFLHHEGEVWDISSSYQDPNMFATKYSNPLSGKSVMKAMIWKLNPDFSPGSSKNGELESVLDLSQPSGGNGTDSASVVKVIWCPETRDAPVITLSDSCFWVWDINEGVVASKMENSAKAFGNGVWNPHHDCNQILTTNETSICGWDLRSMKSSYTIENAHYQYVRDLDFNPNKQYHIMSGGDDCRMKFWDIRKPTAPLKIMKDHSHWVWKVQYNRFHDQLVVSSSSDSRIVLNSVISLSSDPYGHLEDVDDSDDFERDVEKDIDRLLHIYDEHEDSVYSVEWSNSDPWIFASLSYDGRIVINRVPREEKYKILL